MTALLENVFDFSMIATVMVMLHKCCKLPTFSNLLVTLCALYDAKISREKERKYEK